LLDRDACKCRAKLIPNGNRKTLKKGRLSTVLSRFEDSVIVKNTLQLARFASTLARFASELRGEGD
jgi:hypothetical protein